MNKIFLLPENIEKTAYKLTTKISRLNLKLDSTLIIGVGRGGLIASQYVAYGLNIPSIEIINVTSYNLYASNDIINITGLDKIDLELYENIIIIDDLVDSGRTLSSIKVEITYLLSKIKKVPSIHFGVLYSQLPKSYSTSNNIIVGKHLWKKHQESSWLEFPWDTFMERIK